MDLTLWQYILPSLLSGLSFGALISWLFHRKGNESAKTKSTSEIKIGKPTDNPKITGDRIKVIDTKLGKVSIEMISWHGGEIPKTLYKYRDWNDKYHKKLLTHQELFVPSPSRFNDPHDCRISPAYHWLLNDEDFRLKYAHYLIDKHRARLGIENTDLEIRKLMNQFNNPAYIQQQKDDYVNSRNEMLGVYSLTAVNNNILMWAHYANSHKGFCVGFDSRKLFEYFQGTGGDVSYIDSFPEVSPLTNNDYERLFLQTYTKASFWDYEIEYRISKFHFANQTITIRKDVITEILLGCKIAQEDKSEILHFVKNDLPHVAVYQCKPSSDDFSLQIERINVEA